MILFSVAFWLFLFNSLLTMCFIFSSEPLLHPPPLRNLLEVFFSVFTPLFCPSPFYSILIPLMVSLLRLQKMIVL